MQTLTPFDPLGLVGKPITFYAHVWCQYCGIIIAYYPKTKLYEFHNYDRKANNFTFAVLLETDGTYGLYLCDKKIIWYIATMFSFDELRACVDKWIHVYSYHPQDEKEALVQNLTEWSVNLQFQGRCDLEKYKIHQVSQLGTKPFVLLIEGPDIMLKWEASYLI